MHDLTFYWHDYETFGRVPRRDRPAQFAGLRTDAELNEIGAPPGEKGHRESTFSDAFHYVGLGMAGGGGRDG